MCAQWLGNPPDVSGTVRRNTLLKGLVAGIPEIILVSAPSGYGKTVFAAQLAREYERVLWIYCQGDPPNLDAAARVISTALTSDASTSDATHRVSLGSFAVDVAGASSSTSGLVVLDDANLESGAVDPGQLWLFGQVLAQANLRLLITTRVAPPEVSDRLRGAVCFGAEDLRLSLEESSDLADSILGLDLDRETVCELLEATGGHAALFATLSQASKRSGSQRKATSRLATLLSQLARTQLSADEFKVLCLASLLRAGRVSDLSGLVQGDPASLIERCGEVLPLVRVAQGPSGLSDGYRTEFVVHDLLHEHVYELVPGLEFGSNLISCAVRVLEEREDHGLAARLLRFGSCEEIEGFLLSLGFGTLGSGGAKVVVDLLERLPIQQVMSRPELLLLWSDALLDLDEASEAYSRAKAAMVLAEHQGADATVAHAATNALDALHSANRWGEAADLLDRANELLGVMPPSAARAALAGATAYVLITGARYREADSMLKEAAETQACNPRDASAVVAAKAMRALIPCMGYGDFWSTVRALANVVDEEAGRLSQHVDVRGNMAVMTIEIGRISRARAILKEVIEEASTSSRGYFLSVWGVVLFAGGDEAKALDIIAQGVVAASRHCDKTVAAQNRVYEAMLLRAAGKLDESLTSAERAYEALCVQDALNFRRLAVLEIAASMLALGDVSAALAWLEPQLDEGFGENDHHRYRALMIQAEIARRQGEVERAIQLLGGASDHLLSENSNFQAAMYTRAFPHLLGLIAASVGADEVPTHLLRLIPAEVGEGVLQSAKDSLEATEWELLGRRLLGEQQFVDFVARQGSPLCRVRLFGGLEVFVGERRVREKDWRKRKARLLFAILVLERGRQLSREQLLAHVWPDLSEDRAKNNFYVAWSNMKSALSTGPGEPFLFAENTGGLCNIVRDAVRSDVDEFEECLKTGRDCESRGDVAGAIAAYQQISNVYRGELLPGDLYDDWFMPMRERYRTDFVAAMLRLVELLMEADDPCEAAVYARRALVVDPYREDLYQALIRCQITAGQRSAAIETFITCKTQIAEQLGLDPSPDTTALYQEILCMEEKPRYDDLGLSAGRY